MMRIGLIATTLLVVLSFVRADEKEDAERARQGWIVILQACEAYHNNPQNDTKAPPTILLELVKPPFGGPSFLRNGEKDLVDPWGKMYQYAVAKDDKGNLRAYIWTERTVDGKIQVIGTKPPKS